MKYLFVVMLFLCGCNPTTLAQADKACLKANIEGVECVYCKGLGDAIALSCNWSKCANSTIAGEGKGGITFSRNGCNDLIFNNKRIQ